ncbi:MAG: ABC transporter permease [Chloroflexi bacterium]|nr:ABC transporter permease [Chloroflexota bacterium]MBI3339221.1 ABC transporter permease [Chloroflexota bacterium]
MKRGTLSYSTLSSSLEAASFVPENSPARRVWRRFRRHRLAMAGVVLASLIFAMVIFAPVFTPNLPNKQDLKHRLAAPDLAHFMGTDELGRDVFSRVLFGGRISLLIGLSAMAVSVSVGTLIGSISGYFGGRVDTAIMRIIDIIISFPTLFLLIMLASFLGSNIVIVILVIGLLSWMRVARLVRAGFISIKERDFIMAARALGSSSSRMVFGHLLPNSLGPIIVAATIDVSGAILTESALSYLGLGIQPPQATWGNMLRFAQDQMAVAPWTAIFPGLMIFLVSIAINFIGDGLRDAFDPR